MKSKSLAWVVAVAWVAVAGAGCSGSSNEAGTVEEIGRASCKEIV